MTRPAGLAVPTRLLCGCGAVTSIYHTADGLYVRGAVIGPADTEQVAVVCFNCDRPGRIDPVKLRHAIAEQRRVFRIQ